MRSCIVLGSGRSGTSMLMGTLAQAGYAMGEKFQSGDVSNPKGYFEAEEINHINEAILAPVVNPPPRFLGRWFFRHRPRNNQRWLAQIPLGTVIPSSGDISRRIEACVKRQPFCFKDPRFSYTLPVWRPFLSGAAFVCIFRHPADTALSMVKVCQRSAYLRSMRFGLKHGFQVWTQMYRHILEQHCHQGDWLFLHFDQVLRDQGLENLQSFLDVKLDTSFPDPSLRRSVSSGEAPPAALELYRRLCSRAGWSPD